MSKKPKKSTKKKVKSREKIYWDRREGTQRRDTKKIARILLVVAVIAMFIAIIVYYNMYYIEKNIVINDLRWFALHSLPKLLSNLNLTLYLINSNTSADVVREVLNQISDNSYTLATIYSLSYKYTRDAKYIKLNLMFTNLYTFATDVSNDDPEIMLTRLNQSYETLEELYNMLRRLSIEYNYDLYKAPIGDIDDILSLTYKLNQTPIPI
ncbi:hypothetical protein Igag_0867 [Ignisphaera aggregans DSM 17230]|uniref:Uncharacterized protein n=1 Tax=Ignisphaera aggregans (strain DSM 17230 / JCM 13409 / AQ1.S1) TaxID=583356 RepID=E0STR8_IGNAA|nr:hypothetical protein Igag_0867 [Ignisphaera aggregans DSM 17230]